MIENRSDHMPTLIASASTQASHSFVRTRRDQNSWGTRTLHVRLSQNTQAFGPVVQPCSIVYISDDSPPYQAR